MKNIIRLTVLSAGILVTLGAQSFEEKAIDCDEGNAQACYDAGEIHSAQAYKKKDYDRKVAAFEVALLYKKSCNLGYAKGCVAYAMSYASDEEKDPDKDIGYYFQKACDGGEDTGCTMLKMMPSKQ